MSAQVIPLPTLEILTKARTVVRNSRDYDDDVVQTAIQTLMWRGNWIDYEQAAALNKAMQVERANRWLKEQDAAKAAEDRELRRAFKREVLRPALWLAFGFAVAAAVMATVAKAHETVAGWHYDEKCCSGQDCTEVPDGRVTAGPDGWKIALRPGDHPFAPKGFHGTLPYGDTRNRVSSDAHFHVCLGPTLHIRCVYSPPMGM